MKMHVEFLLFSMSIMIPQTALSEYKAIRFNAGENDDFCCCVATFKGSVSPLEKILQALCNLASQVFTEDCALSTFQHVI